MPLNRRPSEGLEEFWETGADRIHRNLATPMLYEEIIKNKEGAIVHLGPIAVRTGNYTERASEDKYIVRDDFSEDKVWWSDINKEINRACFETLFYRFIAYLTNKTLYCQDCYVGSDPEFRIPVRIVTETAWHSLFARTIFRQILARDELDAFKASFTLIHAPGFQAIPEIDGVRSSAFVIIDLKERLVLIGGTSYAGNIKQSVFTAVNTLLHQHHVLPLRCSANMGTSGDVAIFMGRSGTGKTSLAVDPERLLVGDHEHGWSTRGLFNLGWGCYAKAMGLSPESEPELFDATRRFGTILENVAYNPNTRRPDLDDDGLTENTRAAFPISHIQNAHRDGICGHPRHIFLLTCDAFGVLAPIARMKPEQAVLSFLSSYTSVFTRNVDGKREAAPVFSAAFGACPLALPTHEYARMFMENIKAHGVTCWLVNTGWVGEPYGDCERVSLALSRTLIRAAVSGQLDTAGYEIDPIFQYEIPLACPDVPEKLLNPRNMARDEGEYAMRANRLADDIQQNFAQFEDKMPDEMRHILSQVLSVEEELDLDMLGFSI